MNRQPDVTGWIAENAYPLTTVDPRAPLGDLEPLVDMVGDATIVGLARPTHGAHELSTGGRGVVEIGGGDNEVEPFTEAGVPPAMAIAAAFH